MEQNLRFQNLAGSKQIIIETAADLAAAVNLDTALWAVTSLPTDSVVFDQDFLSIVDTDKNKRIRADELKTAIRWLLTELRNYSGLERESGDIRLSAINPDAPDGKTILSTAHIILQNLGTPDAECITLQQILNRDNLVRNSCGNGDGIITADENTDALLSRFIQDAIKACGSVPDITGIPGINQGIAEKFQENLIAVRDWYVQGDQPENTPYGPETADFYRKFSAVEPEINRFFQLSAAMKGNVSDRFSAVTPVDPLNQQAVADFLKGAPCAMPNKEEILTLNGWVNPLTGQAVREFLQKAFELKETARQGELSLADWTKITGKFAVRKAWENMKPADPFHEFSRESVEQYLREDVLGKAKELIAKDVSLKAEMEAYESLRKLSILQKHMIAFVNNFINFSRLFNPRAESLLQPGVLVIDGRHYTLACKVTDIAAHKKIIERSNICVMYVLLSSGQPNAAKSMTIAVAITSGSVKNLFAGKSGIFLGNDGTEWDAKIVDIVLQPVSIGEALLMPFSRFGDFLNKQADKYFTAKSKEMENKVGSDIAKGNVPAPLKEKKPEKIQTPAVSGSMMLMGGGVGLAALGSAFAFLVNTLKTIPVWNVLLVLVGIILIISGPMMFVSIVKLCTRNLSDFMAASGWAVNSRMRLSQRMGIIFTNTPKLPLGAMILGVDLIKNFSKDIMDVPRKSRLKRLILILVLLILAWGIVMLWIHQCTLCGMSCTR